MKSVTAQSRNIELSDVNNLQSQLSLINGNISSLTTGMNSNLNSILTINNTLPLKANSTDVNTGLSAKQNNLTIQPDGAGFPVIDGVSGVRNLLGASPIMVQVYLDPLPNSRLDDNTQTSCDTDISNLASYYTSYISDNSYVPIGSPKFLAVHQV